MFAKTWCIGFALAGALVLPAPTHAARPVGGTSGYTVSRTANGIRLTLQFAKWSYPERALIAVTATIRNLSHRSLAVWGAPPPYGLCRWPDISIDAVTAAGQSAEPPPVIPLPYPPCAAPIPRNLAIGHSFVEHQLIVLLAPRLRVQAQLFNVGDHAYSGFQFQGPRVQLHLYSAPGPTISVQDRPGGIMAVVSPPPGAHGRFYYQSWDQCEGVESLAGVYYWSARRYPIIPAACPNPTKWHLDVAWLNTPIATLNLGA